MTLDSSPLSATSKPLPVRKASKMRLDLLLAEREMFDSREKARTAILLGEISVNGTKVTKAGTAVASDAHVEHTPSRPAYVGRGALKLLAALDAFGLDATGCVCGDIGSSTGGFTQVLLERGATRVYAVDVGTNQLAYKLRSDPRVVVLEQTNARYLTHGEIPEPLDLVVMDLSFISLTLVLPAVVALARPGARIVPLVKPQFEAGRDEVPRGGVIRDPEVRERAVDKVRSYIETNLPLQWERLIESPITGTEGNIEYLACLTVR